MIAAMNNPTPLKASASQRGDVRYLGRNAPAKGTPVPPPATVTMAQLYEIDRLANIGMNLYQIGVTLRIPNAIWEEMIKHNPDIADAYVQGYTRMQQECMVQIKAGALAGDASLLRLFADRGLLGQQWSPPKQTGAVVSVPAGTSVRVDVLASVDAAFERQRALIEGTAVETEAEAVGL